MHRLLVFGCLFVSGCYLDHVCASSSECSAGELCVAGSCTSSVPDGGAPDDVGANEADASSIDANADAPGCHAPTEVRQVDLNSDVSEIDVLVAVDGSAAMEGLDDSIRARVAGTIERVAAGDGATYGIGTYGALPVRVGVVDMDMGLAGVPGCDGPHAFHTSASSADAECARAPVSVTADGTLYYDLASPFTPADFAADVACATRVGTSGCPVARGVDTILAALDPARGFVRPNALLVILVVTAQDDCSPSRPDALASAIASGTRADVACLEMADRLSSVGDAAQRLVTRLHDVSPGWSIDIIAGSPSDFSPAATYVPLTPHVDPTTGNIAPACESTSGFRAAPADRWAQFGLAIANLGIGDPSVWSICGPLADRFLVDIDWIAVGLTGACLAEPVQTDAAGLAACEVEVALPPFGSSDQPEHCADLFHADAFTSVRTEVVTLSDGRTGLGEICHLRQLTRDEATTGAGWVYDDGTLPGFPPEFCAPLIRLHGITVRLGRMTFQCRKSVFTLDRGGACDATSVCHDALRCDPFTLGCEPPCTTDAECASGEICDHRMVLEYFGGVPTGLDPSLVRAACMVPECDPAMRR